MAEPLKYPFAYAWDTYMGSMADWKTMTQKVAEETNAPPTAIYVDGSKRWSTYEEITNFATKHAIWDLVRRVQNCLQCASTFELPPEPKLEDYPLEISVKICIQRGGETLYEEEEDVMDGKDLVDTAKSLTPHFHAAMKSILGKEI